MKKFPVIVLAVILAFLCFACGNSPSGGSITVTLNSSAISGKSYSITVGKVDGCFGQPDNFSKDLAVLSFAGSVATGEKGKVTKFLGDIGFNDVVTSETYNSAPAENSVAFAFGKKRIGEFDVVAVLIRGFNYGKEWMSNLNMGATGMHAGFYDAATAVKSALTEYVGSDSVRLWITGYSRGGGVANMLAHLIISENFNNAQSAYVYTFATPKSICVDDAESIKYTNVFNIVNSADLVTYVAPEEYGFYRCGTDVDVYSKSVNKYLNEFDQNLKFSKFKPDSAKYQDETQFPQYLLSSMLGYSTAAGNPQVKTRAEFAENYQEALRYFAGIMFTVSGETFDQIQNALTNMSYMEMALLLQEGGIYNFLHPFLADYSEIDDEELNANCSIMQKFVLGPCWSGVINVFNGENKSNFSRLFVMHYPETTYVLLKHYNG